MSQKSEKNNIRFVNNVQNKMMRNSLYGALAFPLTNNASELEKLRSELNTEMEIYQTFFKPVKHQEN